MKSWRRITTMLVAAGSLAAIVVLPLGDERQLSVEAWLAVVAGILALFVMVSLLAVVPLRAGSSAAIVRRRQQHHEPHPRLPRNLLATEGMLVSARDNDRAFALRLQPRLIDIAEHYLRTDHGSDGELQSERVGEILGEAAWLLNGTRTKRTPDPSEVELLVDRLVQKRLIQQRPDQKRCSEHRPEVPT